MPLSRSPNRSRSAKEMGHMKRNTTGSSWKLFSPPSEHHTAAPGSFNKDLLEGQSPRVCVKSTGRRDRVHLSVNGSLGSRIRAPSASAGYSPGAEDGPVVRARVRR